jgi:oligoribonuclease
MSETLLWLDLETTGLEPRSETILEVAAFTADLERPFDLTPLYEAVIQCDPMVKAGVDPLVRGMHTQNGLWEACEKSTVGMRDVDNLDGLLGRLFQYNAQRAEPREKFILAGSSVHFDHDFIRVHLPSVAGRLSHRHYDVSAVKLFAQSLGMPKLPKAEAHRAAADVMESVAHAKAVAAWLADGSWREEWL